MGPNQSSPASELMEQEESLEARYNKMVHELVIKNHWAPRKARRFLDSMAAKQAKKSHKMAKNLPKIDVSDITAEVEAEMENTTKEFLPHAD